MPPHFLARTDVLDLDPDQHTSDAPLSASPYLLPSMDWEADPRSPDSPGNGGGTACFRSGWDNRRIYIDEAMAGPRCPCSSEHMCASVYTFDFVRKRQHFKVLDELDLARRHHRDGIGMGRDDQDGRHHHPWLYGEHLHTTGEHVHFGNLEYLGRLEHMVSRTGQRDGRRVNGEASTPGSISPHRRVHELREH